MSRFFQIFNFDPFLAGNGYDTENLNIFKKIMNFHFRLRVLLFDPPTKFSLDVLKKGSLNHLNIFIICGRTVGARILSKAM